MDMAGNQLMKKPGLGLKAQIEADKQVVRPAAQHSSSSRIRNAGREGKKALIAYFSPEVSKTLGRLARDERVNTWRNNAAPTD
jgi:hypothetical protein